jgi:hypothetical protein
MVMYMKETGFKARSKEKAHILIKMGTIILGNGLRTQQKVMAHL